MQENLSFPRIEQRNKFEDFFHNNELIAKLMVDNVCLPIPDESFSDPFIFNFESCNEVFFAMNLARLKYGNKTNHLL